MSSKTSNKDKYKIKKKKQALDLEEAKQEDFFQSTSIQIKKVEMKKKNPINQKMCVEDRINDILRNLGSKEKYPLAQNIFQLYQSIKSPGGMIKFF